MPEDIYQKVSGRIESDWYPYREGEWFTHQDICSHFGWIVKAADADNAEEIFEIRRQVSKKLYHEYKELKEPRLEKKGKAYRLIDKEIQELDWMNANPDAIYKLALPYGVYDQTHFDFEENITIPPKGIVIIAGTSNMGKTAFCLNIVVLNMDKYKVTYFTNELTEIGFKRRMAAFSEWCDLTNGAGKPKFRTILRYDNFQDVLDPDGLNIIDYLDVNEEAEYYKLVPYIKRIQKKLQNGVAVIALQKPPNRPDAFGGSNLRGAASLYLSIDKDRLQVVKAKDWTKEDPNGKKYSFSISYAGSMFGDIKEYHGED